MVKAAYIEEPSKTCLLRFLGVLPRGYENRISPKFCYQIREIPAFKIRVFIIHIMERKIPVSPIQLQ